MCMSDQEEIEKIVLRRLIRLNAQVSGIVTGTIAGGILFIATNWLVLKGGEVIGPNLALLGQFFLGYRVTFLGSFIGLAYGFASGYLVGFSVAFLYNWLLHLRSKGKTDS